ncbi:MAG: Na+/H+ antiporter subunit E [Alphaproteobacteria bacterium]|nr:Na+/H+ antiporter subunit E [Alphaproteobacteria bacterium]
MIYLAGLCAALAALWFALSGEASILSLAFGAVSVLAALGLSARLEIIDRDASPYHRLPQLGVHALWMLGEIAKANVAVLGSILGGRHAISPGMARVEAVGQSDLARALFANSITLTPGTVTVDIDCGVLLVHALQDDGARPGRFAEMNRRAARAADGRG